jgi:hypothetical protein
MVLFEAAFSGPWTDDFKDSFIRKEVAVHFCACFPSTKENFDKYLRGIGERKFAVHHGDGSYVHIQHDVGTDTRMYRTWVVVRKDSPTFNEVVKQTNPKNVPNDLTAAAVFGFRSRHDPKISNCEVESASSNSLVEYAARAVVPGTRIVLRNLSRVTLGFQLSLHSFQIQQLLAPLQRNLCCANRPSSSPMALRTSHGEGVLALRTDQ